MEWICLTMIGTRATRTMIVRATIDQPQERPTESCRCSSSQARAFSIGLRIPATITAAFPGSRRRRGSTDCSARVARQTWPSRARSRTRGTPATRTPSRTGGTCRSARPQLRARGRRHAGRGSGASCGCLSEDLFESLTEPRRIVALQRLAECRPRDQDVVAAGRNPLEPRAPGLAETPLHTVALDRSPRNLRHCDAEPRLAVVVARKPVEN